MTTLITDGYYFVTDHRVTSVDSNPNFYDHQAKPENQDSDKPTAVNENVRDCSQKLVRVSKDLNLFHHKERVVAIASAGANGSARTMLKQAEAVYKDRPFEVLAFMKLRVTMKTAGTFGLVGVTSTGSIFDIAPDKMSTIADTKLGTFVARGSGAPAVRSLLRRINYRKSGLNMGDLIAWAAFNDPCTSPSYSAMDISAQLVYNTVIPTPEQSWESVNKILHLLGQSKFKFPSYFNAIART